MIQFKLYVIKNLTTGELLSAKRNHEDDSSNPKIFRKKYAAKAWISKHQNQTNYLNKFKSVIGKFSSYWENNLFTVVELLVEIKGE